MDDTRVEQAKFELGGSEPSIDAGELPWAYGDNRITAMVRDPDSAYLYWEITDDGIAAARARLGKGGPHGWCNIRIYDTTGREFDGTNANDYFDIRVDRADREYYLMIRRPTSSMHAEIGIKTHEGFFQPIARSGRADFPRNAPSPNALLEWMTVTSGGAPPCVAPFRSRFSGPEPPLPGRSGAGYVDVWRAGYAPTHDEPVTHEHSSGSGQRTIERHQVAHIERWWRLDEWRAEWRSGLRFLRWEHLDPQRIAVELLGDEPHHVRYEGGEMVVYGPWRITIRDFGTEPGRRVVSTWSMRWVRAMTPLIERWENVIERRVLSGWERETFAPGASEALLERGASELLLIGGSERLWIGASEWVAAGASEMLGASRLLFLGASEKIGASEWLAGSEHFAGSRFASDPNVGTMGEKWAGRPEGR
jgi:hypothetical protein